MTLPDPPPSPAPITHAPPERKRAGVGAVVVLLLLAAAILGATLYLTAPVEPTAKARPREAPIDNANPCGHDTFDANACSVRLVMGAAQQANTSPSAVIGIFCARWATPKAQRREIDGWIEQGATRAEGRAVMDHILAYCPEGS